MSLHIQLVVNSNSLVLVVLPRLKRSPLPGISEDKYIQLIRLWLRYKRSTHMTSKVVILDQLLTCRDEELAGKLGNLFWEQQDHKNKEQLLSKMTV